MEKGIAVTGMGIISALGVGVEENFRALTAGKSGISHPEILKTNHNSLPVGEIKLSDSDLSERLNLPDGHSFTRAAMLGAIAAKEALSNAGLSPDDFLELGFISATSVGGIDYIERFFEQFEEDNTNRRFIRAQHPGFTTKQIGNYLNIGGYTTTISTACSSSANAIMLGARLISSGKLKRVLVGGTDCLSKFTLNGFNSLKILSSEPCKPFDNNRSGLNLGEGAAFLLLEAEEVVGNKNISGRITGYGNANDAFHQTASSETGEGAYKAMEQAFRISGILPEDIDYINAHGTATKNNDLSESVAMQRIFKSKIPSFSSTKAFTGHSLAAAGAIEAVFSLLSLEQQQIFPNLNFSDEMEETGLNPVTASKEKDLKMVLSNSFGFGGNCTSLIFRR